MFGCRSLTPLKGKIPFFGLKQFYSISGSPYLGDALATDNSIETVNLIYDKHVPQKDLKNTSPIIMLHGLFGSKMNTRTISKQLANALDRDVYCLDLRNFGGSPHIKRLDYPSMAADVEKLIDDLKLEKPILIGHSMGAKTAMAVALRRPDIPGMLVSVDNAPVTVASSGSAPFAKYVNQLRVALERYKYTEMKDVEKQLAIVEPSEMVRQFLLTNLKRTKKGQPIVSKIPLDIIGNAIVTGKISSWPFDPRLCKWTSGPALFIRGSDSVYLADEFLHDIAHFFPKFEIKEIDAGHWVISEKPKEFFEVVVEFITRHEDV